MLSQHERQKLIIPGWGGDLTEEEYAYIKAQLRESASLKRKWGFRPTAKRLAENRIRAVAKHGPVSRRKASFRYGSEPANPHAGSKTGLEPRPGAGKL